MEQKMKNEKAARIRILRELGMNERQCKRMEEDEFVLLGHTVTPRPEYDDCRKRKEEFEKEYDAIVLFGLLNVTEGEQLLSFVFVSKYENDWEFERAELRSGAAIAMVYNLTEDYSEMGGIRFAFNEDGFPVRTA